MGLDPKHAKLIPLILGERSIEAGTKKAGVSRSRFYDLMKDEHFRAEYIRQSRELVEMAGLDLRATASAAVSTMRQLMTDPAVNEGVRLRAAMAILEMNARFVEAQDLADRINQVEQAIARDRAAKKGNDSALWKLSDEQLHQLDAIQKTLAS